MNKLSFLTSAFAVLVIVLTSVVFMIIALGHLASIAIVIERYAHTITHINGHQLAELMSATQKPVLLDVRDPEEYVVSRIPGALRISPDAKPEEVIRSIPGRESASPVVFYCSIGVRSSQLAERVKSSLHQHGMHQVYNLKGGIFQWHNERRLLEDDQGTTDLVHPFNQFWARFIKRRDQAVR